MIIAVNTRELISFETEEYAWFMQRLFFHLARQHSNHSFYFLIDKPILPELPLPVNVNLVTVSPRKGIPLLWNFWYNQTLPSLLKKIKADVFVSADGICSLQTKVPQCMIIKDLNFLQHPSFLPPSHVKFYKRNTAKFLAKANSITTLSVYMKKEICSGFSLDEKKVHVIHTGVNELFFPAGQDEREEIKQQFADGCEYFLYAGSIHPRKNLINLLRAFSVFKKKQKSNMKLIFCGKMKDDNKDFLNLISTFKFRSDVKILEDAPVATQTKLMAGAYSLVDPSFFEGYSFSLPEAMQCSTPIIVSNTGAFPEIGGNACLYINPNSFEDIAANMMLVYKDETLRNKLIENGRERINYFLWETAAQKMWRCIEMAARPE